jgi:hypothetical protein
MQPNWLLLNAVLCEDPPHNARLVELLLQRGVALEEVDEEGSTALLTAVRLGIVEVRGVAVMLVPCWAMYGVECLVCNSMRVVFHAVRAVALLQMHALTALHVDHQ